MRRSTATPVAETWRPRKPRSSRPNAFGLEAFKHSFLLPNDGGDLLDVSEMLL